MFNPELSRYHPVDPGGHSPYATERDKATVNKRQWPLPLAEDPAEGRAVWFGNEGDDIDPRFERDETL